MSISDILFNIIELDTRLHSKFIFGVVWIHAPVGLEGNKIADEMAKSGLETTEVSLKELKPCPKDIYHWIYQALLN